MNHVEPKTLALWDHRYLWHPFTQMTEWLGEPPLIIERGEGAYLYDVEGKRYLDGVASLWCNVHGHRHPALDAALREQADRVAHSTMLGLSNVPAIRLAKELVERAPSGLTRVFYSDSGATAVEVALKMAAQYWQLAGEPQRTEFVSLTEAYHGDTIGAMSLGYSEAFHRFLKPLLFPCHKLDPPHVFRWYRRLGSSAALDAAIEEATAFFRRQGSRLAAMIVEPLMQGAAGMWNHSAEYLRALRRLTREHGVLLICDEVATGFGRTGHLFAVEQAGIEPDLLCLGKGISGGYLPLAATLVREEIFSAFLGPYDSFRAFFHGHTYTGNPLACAVGLASLEVFDREKVLEHVRARARELEQLLASEIAPLAHVGDIRQCGLMVGIELVADRDSRRSYAPGLRVGHRVILAARRRGVILRPLGNVIVLMPPLCISGPQLEELCAVTRDSIREVTAGTTSASCSDSPRVIE
ncbi:MAG: adenosylmethionine-8-amino-7-oxononanoate aminotransferase [Candidatus Binatia bacterium]|nr:MAG: adenosylmethionine-8-amino-7-oxononanoate aminotransferase [Candidatus Binatia bacterium]